MSWAPVDGGVGPAGDDDPGALTSYVGEVAGVEIGRHHNALDDALAAAGLLRHYLSVGAQRGEEPVAWVRALIEARRFTGWHWDAQRAQTGAKRLTARTTPGTERARPEPESSESRQ